MALSFQYIMAWILLSSLWTQSAEIEKMNLPIIPEGYNTSLGRNEIFNLANEYYRNGNLGKALNGYVYLAELGVSNGYLFYNLGNTYFKLGDLGSSIVWYERALRYLPRYDDLLRNLEYARSKLVDEEFRSPEYGGTIGYLLQLHNMFNLKESLMITLILFWLFTLLLIGFVLLRMDRLRSWLRIPCWIVGIAFILSFLSTGQKIYQYEFVTEAIVLESALEVKTGPGDGFSTAFSIHEGTKVKLVQEEKHWRRIVLPGNESFNGWIPGDAICII